MHVGGLFWSFLSLLSISTNYSFLHFPLTSIVCCLVHIIVSIQNALYIITGREFCGRKAPSTQMCNIKWINISITELPPSWPLTYRKTCNGGSHLDLEHLRVILFLPISLLFVIAMFVALYVVETYTMEIYLYIVKQDRIYVCETCGRL